MEISRGETVDPPVSLSAFRRLDLNLFVVFASIYEHGSLTAAGKAMGLTQPAVSHALARLRDSLNDDLFIRSGRSVVPTPFARRIIDDVHLALDRLRAGPLGEHRFDPLSSEARFRLSMTAGMEIFILPGLLKRMSTEAPNVFVSTTRVPHQQIELELMRGELSLAIDFDIPLNVEARRMALGHDELVTVARKNNPLIADGLDQDTYLMARHVTVNTLRSAGGVEDYELARLGLSRKIVARTATITSALRTAATTDYLVTLGRRQLNAIEPNHELAVFDFPFSAPRLEAVMFWHESFDKDPGNIWLRGMIADLFT
ncbi:MAG: LysR family transcriptional regulator [Pseudomonadales bacterium]